MPIKVGKKIFTKEKIRDYLITTINSSNTLEEIERNVLSFIKKFETEKVELFGGPELRKRIKIFLQFDSYKRELKELEELEKSGRRIDEEELARRRIELEMKVKDLKKKIEKLKKREKISIKPHDLVRVLIHSILLENKELDASEITDRINEWFGERIYKKKYIRNKYLEKMVESGEIEKKNRNSEKVYYLPKVDINYLQNLYEKYVLSKREDVKRAMSEAFYKLIIPPLHKSEYQDTLIEWYYKMSEENLESVIDICMEDFAHMLAEKIYQSYKKYRCLTMFLDDLRVLLKLSQKFKSSRKVDFCLKIYFDAFYFFILKICKKRVKIKRRSPSVLYVYETRRK